MSDKATSNNRYLSFSLGTEEYAVPMLSVKEVIALPEITPLPHTPPHFLGIMNLRGLVISVIDLRQKFKIKSKPSAESAVIILDFGSFSLGAVVDSVNSVLTPNAADLSDRPNIESGIDPNYITSIYKKDKRLVLLLDIFKALNVEDRQALAEAQNQSRKAA